MAFDSKASADRVIVSTFECWIGRIPLGMVLLFFGCSCAELWVIRLNDGGIAMSSFCGNNAGLSAMEGPQTSLDLPPCERPCAGFNLIVWNLSYSPLLHGIWRTCWRWRELIKQNLISTLRLSGFYNSNKAGAFVHCRHRVLNFKQLIVRQGLDNGNFKVRAGTSY